MPIFIGEIFPLTLPSEMTNFPLGQKIVKTQINLHNIFFLFQSLSFFVSSLNTLLIALSKLLFLPPHLAEKIPGLLFNILISRPESSEMHIFFDLFEKNLALISEFSCKDFPSSMKHSCLRT